MFSRRHATSPRTPRQRGETLRSFAKKSRPRNRNSRACAVCFLLRRRSRIIVTSTGCSAAACYRRSLTYGSCYSSPHVQSKWFTDHLQFRVITTHQASDTNLAQPSRVTSRVTVGRGREGGRDIAVCISPTGTPALVWLSTARRRALIPRNAFPGTIRRSRSASERSVRHCFQRRGNSTQRL